MLASPVKRNPLHVTIMISHDCWLQQWIGIYYMWVSQSRSDQSLLLIYCIWLSRHVAMISHVCWLRSVKRNRLCVTGI